MSDIHELVKAYTDQGIPVLPCRNKEPQIKDWPNQASTDPNKFEWREDNQVGILCGDKSGIVVVDIDVWTPEKEGKRPKDPRTADEIKDDLEDLLGITLPDTYQVETPSKGRHLYFRVEKTTAPNKVKAFHDSLPVDLRSNGGQVIAADYKTYFPIDTDLDNLRSKMALLPIEIENFKKSNNKKTDQAKTAAFKAPPLEIIEIREALDMLDADDRDLWVKVGLALKSTGYIEAFPLWNEWSMKSAKYKAKDMHYRWKTFKPKEVTIASIIGMALNLGYVSIYDRISTKNPRAQGTINIDVHSFNEVFQPKEPINWQVENTFIKGSVIVLTADAGDGKTFFSHDIGTCIALGKPWLGREVKQCPVLIIDEESGLTRLEKRLKMCAKGHGAGPDTPIYYTASQRVNMLKPDFEKEILHIINERKIGYVVVDALMEVAEGAKENSNDEMLPVMMAFRRIAGETEATFFVIHHNSKNNSYRGATAIKGACDVLLNLKAITGGKIVVNTEKNRDGEPFEIIAKMNFQDDSFLLEETELRQVKKKFGAGQEHVLRFLWEHGESPKTEIEAASESCSVKSATAGIYSLAKEPDKYIQRVDSGGPGTVAVYDIIEDRRAEVQEILNLQYSWMKNIVCNGAKIDSEKTLKSDNLSLSKTCLKPV